MVKDLREELHKAKEAAQLQKEAAEAESKLLMLWGWKRLRAG